MTLKPRGPGVRVVQPVRRTARRAASLPGEVTPTLHRYRPRELLADGTLFFDSKRCACAGREWWTGNVYEYEGGRFDAISDAAGGYESFFLDASPDGENVFFASADRLLPKTGVGISSCGTRTSTVGSRSLPRRGLCKRRIVPAAGGPQPDVRRPRAQTFSGRATQTHASGPTDAKPKTVEPMRAEKLAKALKACRKDKKQKRRSAKRRRVRDTGESKKAMREIRHQSHQRPEGSR